VSSTLYVYFAQLALFETTFIPPLQGPHIDTISYIPDREDMLTVLVVEDDTTICELIVDLLQEYGFHASFAHSCDEALATAISARPHLILSDIMLPTVTDSEQLIAQLHTHPVTSMIPIVLMSNCSRCPVQFAGLPFLPKPFDIWDLMSLIRQYAAPTRIVGEG
jgi:CheY-like chemotaxis protein